MLHVLELLYLTGHIMYRIIHLWKASRPMNEPYQTVNDFKHFATAANMSIHYCKVTPNTVI